MRALHPTFAAILGQTAAQPAQMQQLVNRAEARVMRVRAAPTLIDELHGEIEKALMKGTGTLPSWSANLQGDKREVTMTLPDVVMEALDHGTTGDALLRVLAASKCPLVSELRARIQTAYVVLTADGLAEVRAEPVEA